MTLPAREPDTLCPQVALVTLGEGLDELVGMGHLCGGFYRRLRGLGGAVGDVVEDIPREQRRLLGYQCNLLAPAIQRHLAQVHSPKTNRTGYRIIKPQHELEHCRLAGA